MQAVAIATGIGLGAFAAWFWQTVTNRSDTKSLWSALARAVRAMLSDQGNFLVEYAALLVSVGWFVLWNVLALVGALAPMLLVLWYFQPSLEENQVLLIVIYSITSMAGIFWLRRRTKHEEVPDRAGLSVSDSQYFFLQVVENAPWLMRSAAALDSRLVQRQLKKVQIDRPVFITGLARSGTTMLLELLAQSKGVATHRYRDFPFLMTPYLWSRFVDLFGAKRESIERPHQDGIQITPESPEAFEEPIWQTYFPDAHRNNKNHVLNMEKKNLSFDEFFREHIRKVLLIRKGTRYLSKGNYNLTRIEYLAALFPDARFIVPIRHPLTHVTSLVRQHELFCKYTEGDARVPNYLKAAGHFEFGPQRVPISVGDSSVATLAAWKEGNEHLGYAIQWAAVYGYVFDLIKRSPELASRVRVVRYEDICDNPRHEVALVLRHADLEKEGAELLEKCDHIGRSNKFASELDATSEAVWAATEKVATAFGYNRVGYAKDWSI